MNIELSYEVLNIMQTMLDAIYEMKNRFIGGNVQEFNELSMDLWNGLTTVSTVVEQNTTTDDKIRLKDVCKCALESLKDIKILAITSVEKVEWKLEYELAPIIECGMMQFYYWAIVYHKPEEREKFESFLRKTKSFELLGDKIDGYEYPIELEILITGYNHFDYTKQCVESVLRNLPQDIVTEVVVLNHGSTDETKTYFESIQQVKVINVAVNGAVPGVNFRVSSRGKYILSISNDIIIGDNAIRNLYYSVKQHTDYGYVVPTTPAVSNLQTIEARYSNFEELSLFTRKNNIYNEKRHEQRVRLCNPLCIFPTKLMLQLSLEMYEDKCCGKNINSFPDDRNSLWMRRHGYKCILAKDSYCHHFGSVTLSHDLGTQEEQQRFYLEGRIEFKKQYGVDPWETGFCYDPELFRVWDICPINGAHVLGINCGLGSNSLKIKEIIRERGGENVVLYNATQEERFVDDLCGVSDETWLFQEINEICKKTNRSYFEYIIIEEPIKGEENIEIVNRIHDAGLKFYEMAYKNLEGSWEIYRDPDTLTL